MILKRLGLALILVIGAAILGALLVAPVRAQGLDKGSTILSLQLAHGDGDFATPESFDPGFITAYDHSEWGGQVHLQHLTSPNWAIAFSAGIGTTSETDSPGSNAAPGSPDFDYSQSSWNVRFGMDRFAHLSPDFHLYVGPGLQYWSGKGEFEEGTISVESESANRIALSGRVGAIVGLGGSVSLNGHLGGYIGRASAEDEGAEVSWTPSGHDGAVGIAFVF
jgi:hypothetical protein